MQERITGEQDEGLVVAPFVVARRNDDAIAVLPLKGLCSRLRGGAILGSEGAEDRVPRVGVEGDAEGASAVVFEEINTADGDAPDHPSATVRAYGRAVFAQASTRDAGIRAAADERIGVGDALPDANALEFERQVSRDERGIQKRDSERDECDASEALHFFPP